MPMSDSRGNGAWTRENRTADGALCSEWETKLLVSHNGVWAFQRKGQCLGKRLSLELSGGNAQGSDIKTPFTTSTPDRVEMLLIQDTSTCSACTNLCS